MNCLWMEYFVVDRYHKDSPRDMATMGWLLTSHEWKYKASEGHLESWFIDLFMSNFPDVDNVWPRNGRLVSDESIYQEYRDTIDLIGKRILVCDERSFLLIHPGGQINGETDLHFGVSSVMFAGYQADWNPDMLVPSPIPPIASLLGLLGLLRGNSSSSSVAAGAAQYQQFSRRKPAESENAAK